MDDCIPLFLTLHQTHHLSHCIHVGIVQIAPFLFLRLWIDHIGKRGVLIPPRSLRWSFTIIRSFRDVPLVAHIAIDNLVFIRLLHIPVHFQCQGWPQKLIPSSLNSPNEYEIPVERGVSSCCQPSPHHPSYPSRTRSCFPLHHSHPWNHDLDDHSNHLHMRQWHGIPHYPASIWLSFVAFSCFHYYLACRNRFMWMRIRCVFLLNS